MSDSHLNIFLDSNENRFIRFRLNQREEGGAFVRAVDEDHLKRILKSLHPKTRVLIWIHLEGRRDEEMPPGLEKGNDLKEHFPNLDKIIYLSLKPKRDYPNKGKNDLIIGNGQIRKTLQTEKPIPVDQILCPNYPKIEAFTYVNPFAWDVRRFINEIDEETMKEIIGTVFKDRGGPFRVEVIQPGFSGALVCKVSCKRDRRDFHYLLKIAKEPTDLEAELKQERLIDLDKYGFNFILAFNRDDKLYNVRDWYCLKFRFDDKLTLRKYLQNKLLKKEGDIMTDVSKVITNFNDKFYDVFRVENDRNFVIAETSPGRSCALSQ